MIRMLKKILSEENISTALEYLQQKPDSFGIDGVLLSQLSEYWNINGSNIVFEIQNGLYTPKSVLQFEILTKKGTTRTISKFCSIDRLLLRAIYQILEPQWSASFSEHSYAYRSGVGTLDAVKQAVTYIEQGNDWVVEIDIYHYFDCIPHEQLLSLIEKEISNPALYLLVEKYLKCQVVKEQESWYVDTGILQGSSLSPLLANRYLHEFDVFCKQNAFPFIRFADDIRLFAPDHDHARQLLEKATTFLTKKLLLPLAKDKTGIYPALGRSYLGYVLKKHSTYIEIIRKSRANTKCYQQWTQSSLEYRSGEYHLIGDGILTKKDGAVLFENEERKQYIPAEVTDTLNVYGNVTFGSSFFLFANEKNLTVNFFDRYGVFKGSFNSNYTSHSINTSLCQLFCWQDEARRLSLAKEIIMAGIHNLRVNICYYNRRSSNDIFATVLQELSLHLKQMKSASSINELMMIEARARASYFSAYNAILAGNDFTFTSRTRRPPQDEINALISFGNMYLYRLIAQGIHKTSLDIRISFLHSPLRRKESLHLDVAEIFKPFLIDRTIFSLINKHVLSEEDHFEKRDGGIMLNKDGKDVYLTHLDKKMQKSICYQGISMTYRQLIRIELFKLISHFQDNTPYKAYRIH